MIRTMEIAYTEYWVIRVVKDKGNIKTVVNEIEFLTPPTEQEIVDVLIKCQPNEFVTVSHNYRWNGK